VVRPLVFGSLCLTCASGAFAQVADPRIVELDAAECTGVPYDRASLLELLKVELGALGVERVIPSGTGTGAVRLAITPRGCDPNTTELALVITRAGAAVPKERRMPLADVPLPNRSRALAIALAELLREPDAVAPAPEPAPTPAAPVPALATPVPPAPAPGPSAVFPETRPPVPWLGAGTVIRSFPSRSIAVFGLEGFVELPVASELRLSLGLDAQTGEASPSKHSTSVGAVTAFVGVGWMFGDVTQLELGPRLHLGYGWAKDVFDLTNDPTSDHVVALGTLAGTLHIGFPRAVHGHIGLEMGVGLLDAAVLDESMVDDRGDAAEIGPVIELGVRMGVDYEL
jgi:hypothetical protein